MKARDLALATLDSIDLPDWPVNVVRFPPRQPRQTNHPDDAELAQRIRIGVIENLLRLNSLIEHYAQRPLRKVDPVLRKIIGIGLYQLIYLDRIPHAAAVDEAVKQAKSLGRQSAAGFVNAVLRRATRDPAPPLPDPAIDPREYARLAYSHPPELFDRLEQLIGAEKALRFCKHSNLAPPTILRMLNGTVPAQLQVEGITFTPHRASGMFVVKPTPHALLREWSFKGLAQAQDPTSAAVLERCDIQPGQIILDRCAGRGTKAMQIAERLGRRGRIVAIDSDRGKLQGLEDVVRHRQIPNVYWCCGKRTADAQVSYVFPKDGFDRILIDAPCSNSGVLARRSAARYAQTAEALNSLKSLQQQIVSDTAPYLKPGGLLIYATCSIWPEENRQIVDWLMQSFPMLSLQEDRTTWPSIETDDPAEYHDGGYVAVLQRKA